MNCHQLCKSFEQTLILDSITYTFLPGTIYGLVGENGAGKSTLLRLLSGILHPTQGTISIQGVHIEHSDSYKASLFFIAEDPYFFPQFTISEMKKFYQRFYPTFNEQIYHELLTLFGLQEQSKIHHFSKGMKRHVSFLFAFAIQPAYLFLDEAFDGLDPNTRLLVKEYLLRLAFEHQTCIIISSHNIKEMEDFVDTILLLHHHQLVESEEQQLYHKYQIVFQNEPLDFPLETLKKSQVGSVYTYYFKGDATLIASTLHHYDLRVCDALPLSLEERIVLEMHPNQEVSS